MTSCNNNQEVKAPEKHQNIPESAFWQGGIDGGFWYDCNPTEQNYRYHCIVYNDSTGDVIIDDLFDLFISVDQQSIPIHEYAKMKKWDANKIAVFDGSYLHLNGTLELKPVNGVFKTDE